MIAYDKDGNEILKINNAQLKNCEIASEVSKALNHLGTTVAEFT